MRFFFDNCISPAIAEGVLAFSKPEGHEGEPLRRRFAPDTKDEVWLPEIAVEDPPWIVVSGDLRIVKNPKLREVWKAARLTTFFMSAGFENQKFWIQARFLIEKWPTILSIAASMERGAGFTVPLRGKRIEQLVY